MYRMSCMYHHIKYWDDTVPDKRRLVQAKSYMHRDIRYQRSLRLSEGNIRKFTI